MVSILLHDKTAAADTSSSATTVVLHYLMHLLLQVHGCEVVVFYEYT